MARNAKAWGNEGVSKVGIELNQTTFLNAESAEEFAEERKGQHFSAAFAKTFASSALRSALNNHTSSVLTYPQRPRCDSRYEFQAAKWRNIPAHKSRKTISLFQSL